MISCNDARQLLPGYLDGELSEAQASPVRSHMLDCCACREVVQEGKVLSRWFHEGQGSDVAVPKGFSARIARRAFAGDPGELVSGPRAESTAAAPRSLLPFLLKLSAVAAVLLFVLALQIRRMSLPGSHDAEASNYTPPWARPAELPRGESVLGLPAGAEAADFILPAPEDLAEETDETKDGAGK